MIKIVNSERHFAQNRPTGIVIHTGTRYFAAVLLQEYYEFWRYAFWFWLVPIVVAALAGYFLGLPFVAIGLPLMLLAGKGVVPLNVAQRELQGQAIEIAAIKDFYGRQDMKSEYYLQARSMLRSDGPYKAKGFWPDIPAIDPVLYTNEMAIAGVANTSIGAMIWKLEAAAPFAEKYVAKHKDKLVKWRPLGSESSW